MEPRNLPLDRILSQLNPVHVFTPQLFEVCHFSVLLSTGSQSAVREIHSGGPCNKQVYSRRKIIASFVGRYK
jgi:hypothetical protein